MKTLLPDLALLGYTGPEPFVGDKILPVNTKGETNMAEQRDPWANRSERMRCWTCIFYVEKANEVGRCRRRSPTLNGYPVVFQSDWCGDHKLNEETFAVPELIVKSKKKRS